jgi:hypothetical protein
MPERRTRESSVENGAELRARGKEFRLGLVPWLMANPPAGPSDRPSLSRIERERGSLSGAQAWVANNAVALNPKVLSALASDRDSLLFDSLSGVMRRAMEQAIDPERWSEKTEPVILPYRDGRVRFGVFDWTTDQDAFIEALLGRPVPRSPRYEPDVPILPVRFESEFDVVREQLGASIKDTIALFGLSANVAARDTGPLDRVVANMADGDAVQAAVGGALVRTDPDGFAASSLGRLALGIMRAAHRWRTPRADFQFAGAYDLGIAGSVGLAFWSGAWQLRSYRAAMAAHLRYLFDYKVAPQRRWPDKRTQREAMTMMVVARGSAFLEPGQRVTRPDIARYLRTENVAEYEGEDEAVTVRRLYRISEGLQASGRPKTKRGKSS